VKHGGNFPPYIQTQKLPRYQALAQKLVQEGKAYYCFCTKEQLQKDRDEALANGLTPKYRRTCLNLSKDEVTQKLNANMPGVIRLKMKDDVEIK
jgi:glutamyl/glutaminyl-tRNA synthetase